MDGSGLPLVLMLVAAIVVMRFDYLFGGDYGRTMPTVRPHAAWLRANKSRPWEAAEWSAEPMDMDGLAYRLPRFLTTAECEHVMLNVAPHAGFNMQSQDRLHKASVR